MSYPKNIEEYTDAELTLELTRRADLRRNGLCDYCARPPGTEPCKFPKRHRIPT